MSFYSSSYPLGSHECSGPKPKTVDEKSFPNPKPLDPKPTDIQPETE